MSAFEEENIKFLVPIVFGILMDTTASLGGDLLYMVGLMGIPGWLLKCSTNNRAKTAFVADWTKLVRMSLYVSS